MQKFYVLSGQMPGFLSFGRRKSIRGERSAQASADAVGIQHDQMTNITGVSGEGHSVLRVRGEEAEGERDLFRVVLRQNPANIFRIARHLPRPTPKPAVRVDSLRPFVQKLSLGSVFL